MHFPLEVILLPRQELHLELSLLTESLGSPTKTGWSQPDLSRKPASKHWASSSTPLRIPLQGPPSMDVETHEDLALKQTTWESLITITHSEHFALLAISGHTCHSCILHPHSNHTIFPVKWIWQNCLTKTLTSRGKPCTPWQSRLHSTKSLPAYSQALLEITTLLSLNTRVRSRKLLTELVGILRNRSLDPQPFSLPLSV